MPASLRDVGLTDFWAGVRARVDLHGGEGPATMQTPPFAAHCRPAVETLLGHAPTSRFSLSDLEAGLARRGVGSNLDAALNRLGYPADAELAARRTARYHTGSVRAALTAAIEEWPEPWAVEWGAEVARSGLLSGGDTDDAAHLCDDVRRLLDHVARSAAMPTARAPLRTELAARLFGSAHALDSKTRLATAAERALRFAVGAPAGDLHGRELWAAAGVAVDSVSAPALTRGLRLHGSSPLARMVNAASDGGLPVHVSLRALRNDRAAVRTGTPVLVVENPSLVETAADAGYDFSLVCANGNPTAAVMELVAQLQASGARTRYHGDFDTSGIAICRRMSERGCKPWMMDADDYTKAVEQFRRQRVQLPHDPGSCGATPWSPQLEAQFDAEHAVIHEELVADQVLSCFSSSQC